MAKVVLASGLARWMQGAAATGAGEIALQVPGDTVRGVLEGVFAQHPALRGYVLDEHGVVRHHVAVFVDGSSITRKTALDAPVAAQGEVYVMQALSGG